MKIINNFEFPKGSWGFTSEKEVSTQGLGFVNMKENIVGMK